MKKFLIALFLTMLFSNSAIAGRQDCGEVSVVTLLSGPRHGSMMLVSNSSCGNAGWVCLDPDGEHMSAEESKRLYSQVLAFHIAGKKFNLSVYDDVFSSACGTYPVVEDLRG